MDSCSILCAIYAPKWDQALRDCLDSLIIQTQAPDLIWVLCPSAPDSTWSGRWPQVRFQTCGTQSYGAALRNLWHNHRAEFWFFLDPHILLAPDYLQWAMGAFRHGRSDLACVHGLVFLQESKGHLGSTLFSRGMTLSPERLPLMIDRGTPSSHFDFEPQFVFGPTGLCSLIQSTALFDISQHNPLWVDDLPQICWADLGWRLGHHQWKTLCAPDAKAWIHAQAPIEHWQYCPRTRAQRLHLMLRHEQIRDFVRRLPALALGEFLFSLRLGLGQPSKLWNYALDLARQIPRSAPHWQMRKQQRVHHRAQGPSKP